MTHLRKLPLLAALVATLSACSDPSGTDADAEARLERNRQRWNAAGIDDYRMRVRLQGAWFGGTAVIEVRDGVPVSITPDDETGPEPFRSYDTVEKMFAVVARAIEQEAYRLDVEYERDRGIPTNVYVDLHRDWVDEEHGFVVEDFRSL